MTIWVFVLRGGPWDGYGTEVPVEDLPATGLPELLYVYRCGPWCVGHMEWELGPDAPIDQVLVYRREDVQEDQRLAYYVLGDLEPDHKALTERQREPLTA